MSYTRTPRERRLPPDPYWDESTMILPTLISQVLRNVCGDLVDVQPSAVRGDRLLPEVRPAIRVRPRGKGWVDGNRLTGSVVAVTFADDAEPLLIKPFTLVDRTDGTVLPEYMTGLPGVRLKLRTVDQPVIRNQIPRSPSYAAHYWSCSATL